MTDTIQHLTYDDFGRVIRNDRGGRKADMSYEYDQLHGWTTGVKSGGGFEQKLYRETGANTPRWDGSIAAMEWKTGEDYIRRYDYEYDGLHRLTDAEYSYSQLQKNPNGYTPLPMPVGCDNEDYSVEYSYDLNSNISSIYRQGRLSFGDGDGYDTVEDDYIERNGNQLKSYNPSSCGEPYYGNFDFVNGSSASVQYVYNANGALTRDLNKGITIEYDLLGNPKTVTLSGNRYIEYVYAADGRRLKMRHVTKRSIRLPGSNPLKPSPSSVIYVVTGDSTDYQGNLLLKNGKAGMYQFQGGYYSFNSNGVLDGCHYYIQDYQGNNRMVVNKNGTIEQITHYYPYGELMADISTNPTKQEFKYGGKELDRTFGLDLYDYHARQQDPKLGCFTSIDPLAEKYYWISPYAYCAGDPVNLIDPTGMYLVDSVGHISDDGNRNVLTSVDGSTKKINKSQGEVLDQLIDSQDGNKDKQGKSTKATAKSNISKKSAVSLFRFLAHHSKVEWSLTAFKSGGFGFGTIFQEKSTISPIEDWSDIKWQVHSHPSSMVTSAADQQFAKNAVWIPWTEIPQQNVAPLLFLYHVPSQTMIQYSWRRFWKTESWEFPGQDASSGEDAEGIKDAVGIISVIDKTNSDL